MDKGQHNYIMLLMEKYLQAWKEFTEQIPEEAYHAYFGLHPDSTIGAFKLGYLKALLLADFPNLPTWEDKEKFMHDQNLTFIRRQEP